MSTIRYTDRACKTTQLKTLPLSENPFVQSTSSTSQPVDHLIVSTILTEVPSRLSSTVLIQINHLYIRLKCMVRLSPLPITRLLKNSCTVAARRSQSSSPYQGSNMKPFLFSEITNKCRQWVRSKMYFCLWWALWWISSFQIDIVRSWNLSLLLCIWNSKT